MGIIDVGGLAKGIKDFASEEYKRYQLESDSKEPYPVNSARRAVCYAAKIYNYATDGGTMDLDKIDYLLWLKNGGKAEGVRTSTMTLSLSRAYNYAPTALGKIRGEKPISLKDTRPGLVIVRVEGKYGRKGDFVQTYVVFRGSRGDLPGPGPNPQGAGWTEGVAGGPPRENVDWTANFDNEQVMWPLGGAVGDVKVHRGFLSIYTSMRAQILQELRGGDSSEIIVTGHSLGGGLSTLCAYDLRHELPDDTIVYLSFNAPRAGNEGFALDFNRILADQTYSSVLDGGGYKQAFRFDQRNDPITFGQRHSAKHNYVSDYKALPADKRAELSEKTLPGKLGGSGLRDKHVETAINKAATGTVALRSVLKDSDSSKPFFHVKHKKTVSFFGMHAFTAMLDTIVGSGSSAAIGIHD